MASARSLNIASVVLVLGLAGDPVGGAEDGPAQGASGDRVQAPGVVETWRPQIAFCRVEGSATIVSILPEGAVVKKGELVCVLDSAQFEDQLANQLNAEQEARDAYLEARAAREAAERENADVTRRKADETARRSSWERIQGGIKYLRNQVGHCKIVAPADGRVVHANDPPRPDGWVAIAPGATVRTRQILFKVTTLSDLVVSVKVEESIIDRIKVGQRARVTLDDALAVLDGEVLDVAVLPDPLSFFQGFNKVYTVIVKLKAPPKSLRAGLRARVEILAPRPR